MKEEISLMAMEYRVLYSIETASGFRDINARILPTLKDVAAFRAKLRRSGLEYVGTDERPRGHWNSMLDGWNECTKKR